jgi:hypothetical protein
MKERERERQEKRKKKGKKRKGLITATISKLSEIQ